MKNSKTAEGGGGFKGCLDFFQKILYIWDVIRPQRGRCLLSYVDLFGAACPDILSIQRSVFIASFKQSNRLMISGCFNSGLVSVKVRRRKMDVLWSISAVNSRCNCGAMVGLDTAEHWWKQVTQPPGDSHELNICNQHCHWEIKACVVQAGCSRELLRMCGHLVDWRRMLVIQQCPHTPLPPFCHCNCTISSGSVTPWYSASWKAIFTVNISLTILIAKAT